MTTRARGYRTSDDVHRALRIRAAETGETMESILDRALRKELGMMFEHLVIRYAFLGGNLFHDDHDEDGTYDEPASVARYAEQCRAALEREYPGARIEISYQLNASGGDGDEVCVEDTADQHAEYRPGDAGELGRMADRVQELIGQVWVSWEWPVYMADRRDHRRPCTNPKSPPSRMRAGFALPSYRKCAIHPRRSLSIVAQMPPTPRCESQRFLRNLWLPCHAHIHLVAWHSPPYPILRPVP
jgi:plasmid stability protein